MTDGRVHEREVAYQQEEAREQEGKGDDDAKPLCNHQSDELAGPGHGQHGFVAIVQGDVAAHFPAQSHHEGQGDKTDGEHAPGDVVNCPFPPGHCLRPVSQQTAQTDDEGHDAHGEIQHKQQAHPGQGVVESFGFEGGGRGQAAGAATLLVGP